jgi:hypothetical protein
MAFNSLTTTVTGLYDSFRSARKAANIYSELSFLSDASLHARGLNRSELPAYALKSAFGE